MKCKGKKLTTECSVAVTLLKNEVLPICRNTTLKDLTKIQKLMEGQYDN